MIKPWGIKERAVFLALAPAIVIAVSLTAYFVILRYADVDSALQNRGLSLVRQLAPAAQYGTFSGNRSELLRLIQATAREPDVSGITIYDVGGRSLASAGNPVMPLEESPARQGEDLGVDVFRATIPRPNLPFDDPFLALPSAPAKNESNLGTVVLELSRSDLDTRKHEILWVTLLSTLAVLVVAALLARRLGRDITEPVLALADAVDTTTCAFHRIRRGRSSPWRATSTKWPRCSMRITVGQPMRSPKARRNWRGSLVLPRPCSTPNRRPESV